MKRDKLARFTASKEAKAKYEKVLSKYIKERKAATEKKGEKTEAAAPQKTEEKK